MKMSQQLKAPPKPKLYEIRHALDAKYGAPTHPFHERYPGYPMFRKFIERFNSREYENPKKSTDRHSVAVKEFKFPVSILQTTWYQAESKEAEKTVRVDTLLALQEMIHHFEKDDQFATDMEGGAVRGYRGTHPALIQFSSKTHVQPYVQPYMIWEHMGLLRPMMEDPNRAKIMFGCQNDLIWWHRYFDIVPFPVIDVQAVYQVMNGGQPIKLSKFVESCLPGDTMDKSLTHFDWARRHLPEEAIKYATADSRKLFHAWHNYTIDIEHTSEKKLPEIERALKKIMMGCIKPIKPTPPASPEKMGISEKKICREHFYALWNWRDSVARKRDLTPRDIFRDECIVKQANDFPGFEAIPTRHLYARKYLKQEDNN
ncbi:unnamed protein product [Orchesella dallaii]|uniref:3'-5' exonuclease domain-containing protein n=1 Tax=Orchesella dallaii TaxID=48710 RepID=A0ABP1S7F6_9HEXA